MLDISQVETTLGRISAIPSVIGSVIFTHEGEVVRTDLPERKGLDVEDLSVKALGVYMSSELVAKKAPGSPQELKFITLITDQGGVCIVAASEYLLVTLTSKRDALGTVQLALEIAQLPPIGDDSGLLNFDPNAI